MTFKLALRCGVPSSRVLFDTAVGLGFWVVSLLSSLLWLLLLLLLLAGGGGVVWWLAQPRKDTRTTLCTLSGEAELEYARAVFTLCLFSRF